MASTLSSLYVVLSGSIKDIPNFEVDLSRHNTIFSW